MPMVSTKIITEKTMWKKYLDMFWRMVSDLHKSSKSFKWSGIIKKKKIWLQTGEESSVLDMKIECAKYLNFVLIFLIRSKYPDIMMQGIMNNQVLWIYIHVYCV